MASYKFEAYKRRERRRRLESNVLGYVLPIAAVTMWADNKMDISTLEAIGVGITTRITMIPAVLLGNALGQQPANPVQGYGNGLVSDDNNTLFGTLAGLVALPFAYNYVGKYVAEEYFINKQDAKVHILKEAPAQKIDPSTTASYLPV